MFVQLSESWLSITDRFFFYLSLAQKHLHHLVHPLPMVKAVVENTMPVILILHLILVLSLLAIQEIMNQITLPYKTLQSP